MSNTLQNYFVTATEKAKDELIAAVLRLPEEKRGWSPDEKARTALDQAAECALINAGTARMLETRTVPEFDFAKFSETKAKLGQDWNALKSLLDESTMQLGAVIPTVSDEDLNSELHLPWGSYTLADMITMPYWNMSYHVGQINYIASILGCL